MSSLFRCAAFIVVLGLAPHSVHAQDRGGHHSGFGGPGGYGRGDGRGRPLVGGGPSQRPHWTAGEWRHTWYGGRFGWWWSVDDDWYLYPEPIYPYPNYVAGGPGDAEGPPPPMPPPEHFWYRCANPAGFYPYVTGCPGGWQAVAATPPELTGAPPRPPQ